MLIYIILNRLRFANPAWDIVLILKIGFTEARLQIMLRARSTIEFREQKTVYDADTRCVHSK